MNTAEFRRELEKIMPGYNWTVHKPLSKEGTYLEATGIQTSGFNRLSTLQAVRREQKGAVWYEVKYSGFGKKTPWLSASEAGTLAQALRRLQEFYEAMARTYAGAAGGLQRARKKEPVNSQEEVPP
jgi:hypothetical protein